jgi:lipoprotein-anchoring transpeptidase ErfK/SrfK
MGGRPVVRDLPALPASASAQPASGAEPFAPEAAVQLPGASPSPAWRIVDKLVVLGFVVGLTIPALMFAVGLRPPEIENRPLLTAPAFSIDRLLDPAWYSALDKYLTDNLAVRPLAVRLRARVTTNLGGTANPAVILGTGDWMFTREELEPACRFTAPQVVASLDRAAARFAAAGQAFRFIVVPDKHVIYPEKLRPETSMAQTCTEGRRSTMREALARRTAYAVDGWSQLLAARAARPDGPPLYYMADSHWTPSGAIVGIKALIQSLDAGLWRDDDVVPGRTTAVPQELARQVGLPRSEPTLQVAIRPGVKIIRTAIKVPVEVKNSRAVYRITASGNRSLLPGRTVIVYDSFFGLNMARVSSFFEESIWIHVNDIKNHPELSTLLGPFDRVILERVERGLYATDVGTMLDPLTR